MSDVPCPKWLRGEIEPLLDENPDYREVTVSQGVLRKCLWHLSEYERLTAELSEFIETLTEIRDNPRCDPAALASAVLISTALEGEGE